MSALRLLPMVSVCGLLGGCDWPQMLGRFDEMEYRAQVDRAKADLAVLGTAVTEYRLQNAGRLPQDLTVLLEPDASGLAILAGSELPLDPWGNEYVYVPPPSGDDLPWQAIEAGVGGESREFELLSFGGDGLRGGEGYGRDITWLDDH